MTTTSKDDGTANTNYQFERPDLEVRDHKQVAVELRRPDKKGRRIGPHLYKTFRPSSMISLPTTSSASPSSAGRVSGLATAMGKGFNNLARPKAFFSSQQHLDDMLEGFNNKAEDTYKPKMVEAASQVSQVQVKWAEVVTN